MKILGWVLVAIAAICAFLVFDLLNGNPDLQAPGQAVVVGGLQGAWRALLGPLALLAATAGTAGSLVLRGLPGPSYLALLAFVLLSVPYLALAGLAPSLGFVVPVLVILVFVIPALVYLVAFLIGRAVVKRRSYNPARA